MKKLPSLAQKFTIILLIILFIGQGIAFFFFILSLRSSMLDSLYEKMKNTGSLLAGISTEPILANNTALLDAYLDEIIKDQDIFSVKIFDRDEDLLGVKSKISPQKSSWLNSFYIKPYLDYRGPIFSQEEKIGHVGILYTTKRITGALFKHVFIGLIQEGLLAVIIICLIYDFFARNVKKPVSEFVVAVGRVNAGDLTTTIPGGRNREMMTLAREFNVLTARLKNIIQKLNIATYGVTTTIGQLNMIIDRITDGTHKQIDATDNTIIALEKAEESQKRILLNTGDLAEFSQENATSFTQVEAASNEINEKTQELSIHSLNVYSTIANLLNEAKGITKNSEELLSISEETTAAAEQIGANLKEVRVSTNESEHVAFEVSEVLSDIRIKALGDAVNSMDDVETAVDKNLQLVRGLEIKSKDVEKILSVVSDVTKQTNLLSVNAAILASQAGEHGTGFSVVADEIKTLADRTSSSAKEIKNIIKSIHHEINKAIIATEDSKRIVHESKGLVLYTDAAIVNVIEKAQNSSIITKKIQRANAEQIKGILQLNEGMEHLVKIASDLTEIVREQENKSDDVLAIAQKFKEISGFIKGGIHEQNTGIHLISKNLDRANEMIKSINNASSDQDRVNKEILNVANSIKSICNNTISVTRDITNSFNGLHREVEALKKDMEGFKVE
jgi:methyl-accepting chemotaxis protein